MVGLFILFNKAMNAILDYVYYSLSTPQSHCFFFFFSLINLEFYLDPVKWLKFSVGAGGPIPSTY